MFSILSDREKGSDQIDPTDFVVDVYIVLTDDLDHRSSRLIYLSLLQWDRNLEF